MDPREQIRANVAYVQAHLDAYNEMTRAEGATPLTAEQWEDVQRGIDYVAEQTKELAKYDALAGAAGRSVEPVTGNYTPPAINVNRERDPYDLEDLRFTATRSELVGRTLTAIERTSQLTDDQRQHTTQLVERHGGELIGRVLGTGSDAYRSAATKMMTGNQHLMSDAEKAAVVRAQSLTDAAGGYAVPFTLDPTIMLTNAGTTSPLRQISSVSTIVTDSWNGVSSAGATAGYAAEASEVGDDAITLAQPSVSVHRLDVFVPFSFEIGQDWASFESDMREVVADAKTRKENEKFTTGSGTNEPFGFITGIDGTASEITPTTTETFAVADIYKLEEALGDRFLPNASWVANRAIYNDIRQFDTSGGASLWERLGAATPPELIGYPAYKASDMDSGFNAAATADNFILAFGDFRAGFKIVDRVGMNFELVPHLFATGNNRPSGQRGLLMWCRNGSKVVVTEAIKVLNVATTA